MEIKGKVTIFPEKRINKQTNEEFIKCRATISSKNEDGSYNNKSVEVKFDNKVFPREKINKLDVNMCYVLDVESGYLICDSYTNKDGVKQTAIGLFISAGSLKDSKPVEKKQQNGLPF